MGGRKHGKKNTKKGRKKIQKNQKKRISAADTGVDSLPGNLCMGAQKGRETKTYYKSVVIQKGDTIWDIAKEYKAEGQKTEQMVDAIYEVNGLKTANIRTGENIIVPVTREI